MNADASRSSLRCFMARGARTAGGSESVLVRFHWHLEDLCEGLRSYAVLSDLGRMLLLRFNLVESAAARVQQRQQVVSDAQCPSCCSLLRVYVKPPG